MVFAYDLEQLGNLHTATFISIDKSEKHVFVIHETRDDREAYMAFLLQPDLKLVGFNCNRYDYQILHRLITSRFLPIFTRGSSKQLSEWLYEVGEGIIRDDERPVPEWKFLIPHRDLFLVHHYNNKSRATSLKHLEVAMKMNNVQDMPYDPGDFINTIEEVNEILDYNENDVLATIEFYNRSQDEISMRRDVGRLFGLNIMNASDPKIGQEIILKEVAKKKGLPVSALRNLRTQYSIIELKDVILPYIHFTTEPFKKVFKAFNTQSVNPLKMKGSFNYTALSDGMEYNFGVGGLHACREPGSWHSNDFSTIQSADASSYYPNLAIMNKFFPAHLGEDFCNVYKSMYITRKRYPKKTPPNKGLKLALNAAFGKSKDIFSPLYDPMFFLRITVNGQLLLTMLCEMFTVAGFKVIMANTDGVEVEVPNNRIGEFESICQQWEELTKIELEQDTYSRIFIRDVNNYLAEFSSGDIYCKGVYETPEIRFNKNRDWHKDPSMGVIPIVVKEYFINGVPVMDTLRNHEDIMDFMIMKRVRKQSAFKIKSVGKNMKLKETALPTTNRYLIVSGGEGGYLSKKFDSGKVSRVNAGNKAFICNNMTDVVWNHESEDHLRQRINYRFYYQEAMKLITPIITQQTNIF